MIYLDHAATTPTDPRVVEAMLPYLTYEFGNPGSLHCYGKTAKKAVDAAREQVARFFHCEPEQVLFTSGGTEGNNTVFEGLVTELRRRGKNTVIVSAIEHDSVWKASHRMKIKHGFDLRICQPDSRGEITQRSVTKLIDDTVGFVSVMCANNETGVYNDTANIGDYCSDNGILFHSDAVQSAAVERPDTKRLFPSTDFMTISGHKLGGPKGIGALFARDPKLLEPLILGGAEQEFGFRGGTENVPGIVGLGKACELMLQEQDEHLHYLDGLHGELIFMLKSFSKEHGVEMRINGDVRAIMPKTLNVCFPGVDAQSLLLLLDDRQICVSAGSACRAHENIPSRTLTAMGLSEEDARSSIRISLSHLTQKQEVYTAAEEIVKSVKALRDLHV